MGHYVMDSFWCEPLLINTRSWAQDFAFFIFEWTIVKRIWSIKKNFYDSERSLTYYNFTDKKEFILFFLFSPTIIQRPGFTNDYKFCISVNKQSKSR